MTLINYFNNFNYKSIKLMEKFFLPVMGLKKRFFDGRLIESAQKSHDKIYPDNLLNMRRASP